MIARKWHTIENVSRPSCYAPLVRSGLAEEQSDWQSTGPATSASEPQPQNAVPGGSGGAEPSVPSEEIYSTE